MATSGDAGGATRLTPREREALELLRLGLTNQEIANRLGITLDGAKYHVSEIITKLGVRDRYEAARWRERRPWRVGILAPVAVLRLKPSGVAAGLAVGVLAAILIALGLMFFVLVDGTSRDRWAAAFVDSTPTPCSPEATFENSFLATSNRCGLSVCVDSVNGASIARETVQASEGSYPKSSARPSTKATSAS